ncbi:hypothetical protein CR513_32042, partial [Mucuna pruriens]
MADKIPNCGHRLIYQVDGVRISIDGRFLRTAENQTTLYVDRASLVKWSGQSGQQSYPKIKIS